MQNIHVGNTVRGDHVYVGEPDDMEDVGDDPFGESYAYPSKVFLWMHFGLLFAGVCVRLIRY
jgi:hypothetical protein